MKITCTQNRLIEAVAISERVSGKKLTLPVLNCVLLEAKGKVFTLRATNLELGIEITIPAEVVEEGVIAVPGGVLYGTLASLEGSKGVTLEENHGNLLVKGDSGIATIKGQSPEDFPTIPRLADAQSFTLGAEGFARGIRSVIYSASTSSIKPEQASVYIYERDNQLYFVATDSFRLAEKKIDTKGNLPEFDPILIPAKNVLEILRTIETVEGDLNIQLTNNQISFEAGNIYLTSRLIDGAFPDYRQVIPKEAVTEVVVLKQDLVQLFKKVAIFADKSNQVSMHINPKDKSFLLEARNADVGESKDALKASLTGDPLDINFNYRYISECFPSVISDSVSLSFSGLGRPLIVRGASDPSFLYLVMPMNK